MTIKQELYHHGIRGQRWGIRRFQNGDGSLTPKGRKRYDDKGDKKNVIQRHRDNLIDKYKSKGYSQENAEMAAKQRMKAEAIIGAVAAVAVTAVATKAAVRIGQDYCDKTFKQGKIIQNIGANKDETFKDRPFFAAVNKSDKKAYGMLYPNEKRGLEQMKGNAGDIYKNQIQLTKDIKRASVSNARKTFYEKMEKDPEFKKQVLDTMKKTAYSKGVSEFEKTGKATNRLYDSFNQALATPEFQEKGLHKKYYSELQKKGYNAILDINDTRYSGYKNISKAPTIFFGDGNLKKISSEKIDDDTITKNLIKYQASYIAKNAVKKNVRNAGLIAGAVQISNNKKVEDYLNKHPNTKKTRKEILLEVKKGNK